MKILIVTDAWHPQVNGVVRTLGQVAQEATNFGVPVEILSPSEFRTVPMPSYPEIRLALAGARAMERRLDAIKPDAIHVATEGPLGHAMRRVCIRRGLPFTTSFHTRFPDYVAERVTFAPRWSGDLTWAWLRRFHSQSAAVLAATPTLVGELEERRFRNVRLWQRGVDSHLFHPDRKPVLDLPRPIFLTVGRVAVEKNLEEFLKLDLPGTKVVVGDGPARAHLSKAYPDAVFVGAKHGEELADIYASADVFVFPSRTDTFGLVLLEALASGVPVAAFPAAAPRDVIGQAPVGCLDEDLRVACLNALELDRADCRDFAQGLTWEATARTFVKHVTEATQKPRRRRDRDRLAA
ncbi:MAG: glycosyltransferase family 1 protein [Pseudolabrys sp.]|jgi:glycosyltransferase involved in cell wall biosynthesis